MVWLYLLGAAVFGVAGTVYASSIFARLPLLWFSLAGASLLAGVILAVTYWRNPNRWKGVALIVAQLLVLVSNAIARQWVQVSELMKWYDPYKAPIRGEWGSFALFLAMFLAAILIISWIGLTALRRTRNRPA